MGDTVRAMSPKASNARKISDLSRAVAAQICAERSALGLNQKEGYEQIGMPKGTYIRIEKAERPADFTQIEQIAASYGLSVLTLVARASERLNPDGTYTPPEIPSRKTNAEKAQAYRDRTHPGERDERPARKLDA